MRSFLAALLLVAGTGCAARHHEAAATPAQRVAPPPHPREVHGAGLPAEAADDDRHRRLRRKRLLRTDRAIEGEVETVFSLVSPTGRRAFADAERSWLAYRRSICEAEAARYARGTIEPIAFATCEVQQNLRHLDELGRLEGRLRRP